MLLVQELLHNHIKYTITMSRSIKLQADFDGAENPFPVTPSNARVSSIVNAADDSTLVDWSTDLSSWSGSTGELSVVQDSIPGRNSSITRDFIEGSPITVPEDGSDYANVYDTNDSVNFNDEPHLFVGFNQEELFLNHSLTVEIESNRTDTENTVAGDRFISLTINDSDSTSPSGTIPVTLIVQNTDTNTVGDSGSIPKNAVINSTYPGDYIEITFDNSVSDVIKASVTGVDHSMSADLSVDVSTNGIPSNPNTVVSYHGDGPYAGGGGIE
jgi:hypothetical protein